MFVLRNHPGEGQRIQFPINNIFLGILPPRTLVTSGFWERNWHAPFGTLVNVLMWLEFLRKMKKRIEPNLRIFHFL